jgi:hypothetical protein
MNPATDRLLAAINLPRETIPRFRDVWINADFTELTVHTRTGGGNRREYATQNAMLTAHPLYMRDADDAFDSTFADFTFRVPQEEAKKLNAEIEDFADDVRAQVIAMITEKPREKFDKVMEALKK